ncbi:Ferric siderophore transport system, periplasmic binding protein TonB [Labilithrix luteola]|uniref:Ferric siderophore transport system, periplasmic binding protein TonB n=1 Tax=Labilithrix luteola TaxID=1391654 RepID=A0A0K1Q6R9_9BACT|nr:energy transducer TonB [Labilithrix luteola]AKV01433.1 Ferric siderophore transport system, periplasmic binding protein TonB [Labilithrix luteola]
MNRIQSILVGGSLIAHVGVYAWMGALPKEKKTSSVAIALAESKKKTEEAKPKPPEPPPPPKPAAPAPKAKAAMAEPKAAQAPEPPPPTNAPPPPPAGDAPAAMDGFADLGNLAMGNGGGGMAIPTGPRGPAPAGTGTAPVKQVKTLAPVAADDCKEDPVKPQLEKQIQPQYSAEGRQANVEGPVKLEITVDANGVVTNVKVLKGLGFGLDEAAIAAAKQWSFKPATKCGKAVSYTIKGSVRFQLGS